MRRLFQHHPIYGHRFIASLRARVPGEMGGYLVRTNGQGFRSNRDYEPARPATGRRVLLFGDSYTAADGVRNEDRYSDVVETLVPGIEVYNFGMPGTGTDQQYLIFREEAAAIERDLVVVAVLVENIRRNVARYRPYRDDNGAVSYYAKPYFELGPDGALALRGTPVPPQPLSPQDLGEDRVRADGGGRLAAVRRLVNAAGAKDVLQRLTHYQPVPEYDDADGPAWRLLKAILGRFVSEARAPVLLFPIPLYQHVEGTASADAYRARFAELADPPRVRVCDPLDHFHRHDPARRRAFRFEHDVHPTRDGHRVLAEALAEGIQDVLGA